MKDLAPNSQQFTVLKDGLVNWGSLFSTHEILELVGKLKDLLAKCFHFLSEETKAFGQDKRKPDS